MKYWKTKKAIVIPASPWWEAYSGACTLSGVHFLCWQPLILGRESEILTSSSRREGPLSLQQGHHEPRTRWGHSGEGLRATWATGVLVAEALAGWWLGMLTLLLEAESLYNHHVIPPFLGENPPWKHQWWERHRDLTHLRLDWQLLFGKWGQVSVPGRFPPITASGQGAKRLCSGSPSPQDTAGLGSGHVTWPHQERAHSTQDRTES